MGAHLTGNAVAKGSCLQDMKSYIFVETVAASDAVPGRTYVGAVVVRQTAVEKGQKI